MWRQWFFENLESSRSCKKSASKKFFKCILKCLRNMSLNPEYFSQYPGDPSFSFLCNLDFFDQLDFFLIFLEISLKWKKIESWNFEKFFAPSNTHVRVFLNDFQAFLLKLNPWFLNHNHVNRVLKMEKKSVWTYTSKFWAEILQNPLELCYLKVKKYKLRIKPTVDFLEGGEPSSADILYLNPNNWWRWLLLYWSYNGKLRTLLLTV